MLYQLKLKPFYFSILTLILLIGSLTSVLFTKAESFVFINQYHISWLNNFFVAYTFLGDGWISVMTFLLLLFFKKNKEAWLLLFAFASSGLLACIFKNIFSLPRPRLFFEQNNILYNHFIEGITLSNNSSFPSGHTASAFAMATVIILLSNKKGACLIAIISATLVAFSRVYLGQHFLQDITAGAFAGISCAMLGYYIIYQKEVVVFKRKKRNKYSYKEEISPQWN